MECEKRAERRKSMCHAIASLDPDACHEEVSKTLDPLLENFEPRDYQSVENNNKDDGVTPLMVACDGAQDACIEYMEQKIKANHSLVKLFGHPLDHSSLLGQNTAMHHAASSGCTQAIPRLHSILTELDEQTSSLMVLVTSTNENMDTPIMMASASGRVDFMKFVSESLKKENYPPNEIQRVFEMENHDKETALSLACGHGHANVVEFLLSILPVTYEHVQQCQATLQQIDAVLDSSSSQEHRARRNNVYKCLVMLQVTLAKQADSSMEELLAMEDAAKHEKQPRSVQKTKKKQKRKPKGNKGSVSKEEVSSREAVAETNSVELEDSIVLTASATATAQTENCVVPLAVDVVKASGTMPTDESPPTSTKSDDLDVDAVMEALCLDASMLLLSQHGMALNLSPCQLDAIEAVLKNQLDAVEEARRIQSRLRTHGS